ncbi:MAG: glucose/sorbosone dehydrogenase [Gemmatimonadetes bacterium]|nr:glucose/sorbosone dehydrogenase [Gemmatimonadota bacterium]
MKRTHLLLLPLLLACGGNASDGTGGPPQAAGFRLVEVASGLSSPLYLTAPSGDARLFVVEQPGRIRIVKNGQLLPTPFLDITDRVGSGGERGLLGLAFHPRYAANGFLYVDYTDRNGDTRIERYRVSADADRADPASAHLVLGIAQPFANHNGGQVAFGPDGRLYVGMGDGGSGGDPMGNGQNPNALLGKLLRLDVDAADPYAVPADNPFAGQAGKRGEIWATGMRNPWRFSFDREAGLLYVADVGQNAWEEVDVVPAATAGANYGWNVMEGTHCYAPSSGCDTRGLVMPALEFAHGDGNACSVTGGYVYRGAALPALRGTYFYSDYCGGWIRSFRYAGGAATEKKQWDLPAQGSVLSFGEDAAGELYLLTGDGRVQRFSP